MASVEEEQSEVLANDFARARIEEESAPAKPSWISIKDALFDVAKGMKVGEMVHGPNFDLHQAMSALELMDPKMDPGMCKDTIYNIDTALAANIVPLDLDVPSILQVMDSLLIAEASWHNGRALSHSLFLSLYLHRPSIIRSLHLQAFVSCLLHCADLVRSVVTGVDIYDEEDFQPAMFHFSFGNDREEEMLTLVSQACSDLCERVEACQAEIRDGVENKDAASKERLVAGSDAKQELAYAEALLARIQFRLSLYFLHQHLMKPRAAGLTSYSSYLTQATKHLSSIASTLHLARPTTPATPVPGFEASIARSVALHAPPRAIDLLPMEQALQHYRTMFGHLAQMSQLSHVKSWEECLRVYRHFATWQANVIVRSHWLAIVHNEDDFLGRGPLAQWLTVSCHAFSPSTIASTSSEEFEFFINRVARPAIMMIRLYCESYARHRHSISTMLPDWSILQQDAIQLDQYAGKAMLSRGIDVQNVSGAIPYRHAFFAWVFEQTVQLMMQYMMVGFQLEIYGVKELPVVYWYLDYICDVRLQNRAMCYREPASLSLSFNPPTPSAPSSSDKKASDMKKKLKAKLASARHQENPSNPNAPQIPIIPIPEPPSHPEFIVCQALRCLSRGMCFLFRALDKVGMGVPRVQARFRQAWFSNRFEAFSALFQPSMLKLEQDQYWRMPFPNLAKSASADFNTAKDLLASVIKLEDQVASAASASSQSSSPAAKTRIPYFYPSDLAFFRSLQKVAITNSLALMSVKKFADPFVLSEHRPIIGQYDAEEAAEKKKQEEKDESEEAKDKEEGKSDKDKEKEKKKKKKKKQQQLAKETPASKAEREAQETEAKLKKELESMAKRSTGKAQVSFSESRCFPAVSIVPLNHSSAEKKA